jgi:hypothetical protein
LGPIPNPQSPIPKHRFLMLNINNKLINDLISVYKL